MGKQRIHKDCGGVIKNNKCTLCGNSWSTFGMLTMSNIIEKEETFDIKAYRKRLREGKDIRS